MDKNHLEQQGELLGATFDLRWQRLSFFALCWYVASQAFLIPIAAVGPTWATWPTFADFAILLLLFTTIARAPKKVALESKPAKNILYMLIFVLICCVISYVLVTVMFPSWTDKVDGKNTGVFFGAYQLYRLVQFIVLLWATTRITMTPDRLAILRRIVDAVLVFVCMGIVLTFFEVLPKSLLVQHLPADPGVAGPWSFYRSFYEGEGWGTIGYNHAYVGAQVLLLTSLKIHLSEKQESLTNSLLLFVMMLVIFMSGSRAGLAASMAFAAAILWRRPMHAIAITTIALTLIVLTISFSGTAADLFKSNPILNSTAERQMQLANPTDAESLSGRDEIWRDKILWLNEDPTRWITGAGFGSHGHRSAHMLYLQIIVETGLIGLIVFALLAFKVLYHLYHRESGVKPIFWATIALFFSATSQDTYYPVPQCGQFLGFYFVALVIALGAPDYHKKISSNKYSASGVRI